MMAFLEMSPWRRAFWSIPVTLFIVLLWPVPLAHPEAHPLLVIVRAQAPGLYTLWVWGGRIAPGVLFFFSWQVFGSIFNLWFRSLADKHSRGKLPAWPLAVNDKGPALVIGEKHYPTEMREHPHPQWCVMPEKGLYTGLAMGAALLRREVFALFMGLFARGCVSPVLSSGGQQPSQHVPASFRRPAEPRNGTEYRRSVPLGRAPFWTFARRSGTVPWAGGQTCDDSDDRIPGT